jgi:hypothetical protein
VAGETHRELGGKTCNERDLERPSSRRLNNIKTYLTKIG